MTEKEKLKEIIETALGFHDYYKVVVTEKDIDRLTDKLIENGYGNVKIAEKAVKMASFWFCELHSCIAPKSTGECSKNNKHYNCMKCMYNHLMKKAKLFVEKEEKK